MNTDLSPALILLVDDLPENLHVLASALRNQYRIKTATSGVSALELATREDTPDLILLDVMMPGMNGHQVLERLRANPLTREIPVIFVTADDSERSELSGLILGADDYLTKPIVLPLLQARVRNLLLRRKSEQDLRLAAQVFENTSEGIVITDGKTRILEVNRAYCDITGFSREEILGATPNVTKSERHDRAFYDAMWQTLREKDHWSGEIWDRRKSGEIFPKWLTINAVRNPRGQLSHYIGIFSDISVLKQTEEKLHRLAFYDPLTGLPNRVMFRDRLEQEITIVRRYHQRAAILFLDLDRFKNVNDTLGHAAGDILLMEVARRLKHQVRENDTVARLAGDEFILILRDIRDAEAAARVAENICLSLAQPFDLRGEEVFVGASVGISLLPDDGTEAETLTKRADAAMYHAKDAGRGQYRFFTEEMDRLTRERVELENHLRHALERQEFRLHYQPKAEVGSNRLFGAEALLRWHHPQRGLVPPAQFIPLAEENGLILPIGLWVIREVCRQIRIWREMGLPRLTVAVNLSAKQFHQENLARVIGDIVAEEGISPSLIELELTESTVMDKSESATATLQALHDQGFTLAIDDFGTGYSSMAYLKRFPVDTLKIDRSFIMVIPGMPNDAAIARAIIQLARSLGLEVVAEGVETPEQREFLQQEGCEFLQGFWLSRPLEPEAFAAFLKTHIANAKD
ncbi:MAG: EAL domain-containing protein [Magnetococcales bacterium]|nr:EAL domain-containing protein [Magnetococcales bacterium]